MNSGSEVKNFPFLGTIKDGISVLYKDIYGIGSFASELPKEIALELGKDLIGTGYLASLDLPRDTFLRLEKALLHPTYSRKLISFVLKIRSQYTVEENIERFDEFIRKKN